MKKKEKDFNKVLFPNFLLEIKSSPKFCSTKERSKSDQNRATMSKNTFHIYSQLEVWFDQNSVTSRYNKNLKKINPIKNVKNIWFAS